MLLSPPIDAAPKVPRDAIHAAAFVLGLRARGLRDTAVLGAMERVRRELFAPRRLADLARSDVSLPLPHGQTMTAPGTVAGMLVALNAEPGHRVLEIGTGSGYVSALLARLGCRVTSVERYAALAEEAQIRLRIAGVETAVEVRVADGLDLALDGERFERILVNGAIPAMPSAVTSLLAPGGCLVGSLSIEGFPRLIRIERAADGALVHVMGQALRLSPLVAGPVPSAGARSTN
jgi:protein-L-isoaspartate(D-aspartate) O-methyltransferase